MMKTLLRTIGWALLCLLLVPGAAWAQTAPGAPTITTVEAGRSSAGLTLVVTWTAPASDGGSAITAYDVRSIETAADETDDANWSVEENAWQSGDGALSTTLAGLTDSTGYDVQVRAGNEQGDGDWSTPATGTTLDHGDMASEATSLPLDTPVDGVIDQGTDVDYFEFRLTRVTDMLIETRGDLDTVGELQKRDGTVLHSNDDGNLPHGPLNFFLWRALAAGTYRIKVSSYGEETTGSYTLHTTSLVETTFDNPQEIDLDNSAGNWTANGLLYNRPGNPGIDTDFFKVDFSEGEHFIIRTTDPFGSQVGVHDLGAIILDSDGNELASFGDGDLWPHRRHVLIAGRMKNTGTYYIKLGARLADKGPYTLHVSRVTEPGSTPATATPLDFVTARGGTIHPLSDEDYFRLEIPAATHVYLAAVSDRVQINGELLDSTNTPVDTRYYPFSFGPRRTFFFHERLDAGTYYIKVTGERKNDDFDIDAPPYVIHAFEDTDYNRFLADCEDIDTATTISDPLYGCQWHLHNTGQLKGGVPGEDINVEEVWDDNLGTGINVAVVDDGMDYAHEDLSANVDMTRNHDYDTNDQNGDDIYEYLKNHGTAVAGLIAAQDNALGVRGVAPQAKIYGYNLLVDSTAANEADAATRDLATTAVSNNSWGPDDGPGLDAPDKTWEMAITHGVTNGFGGKGIFYVWAAGNGGGENPSERDNSNFDGYANYYGVTAVCAVNDEGQRSAYSEKGANLWVCAPSDDSHLSYAFTIVDSQGITTTDQDDFYRNTFGDTSAATPIVSGVAALIRKANPALSWRDVKLILAASARQNDADNTGWEDGALHYGPETESYHFNHAYGFGVVDAKAAVDLAAGWTNVPALVEETAETSDTLDLAIPDLGTVSSSLTLGSGVEFIEFVEINADFDHAAFRDLQLELISPSGAVSVLSGVRSGFHSPLRGSFRFGSARHLGENPAGEWTLRISDTWRTDVGELKSWSLTVYGHRSTPGAPDLASLTPEIASLTVAWQAPTNPGASAVTGYDVRYIKTTEDETDDANWTVVDNATSGALRYTISSLEDDIAYDVQVRAVNAHGDGAWSDTITETPSGDAPYFTEGTSATRRIDENEAAGAEVGLPVGAEDPTNETLTYKLSGTDVGSFDIDGDGQLTVASGTVLDYEGTKKSYVVTVTATDPSDDSDSIDVAIEVTNVDESPTLTGPTSVPPYAENSIRPVAEYDADDPEDPEGKSLTWSLAGTDSADFTINNGVLSFRTAPDYEARSNNVYEVTVVVSDETPIPATLDVTVTVTNVDEVHTLTELSHVPSYAENGTEPVAEYIVTDLEENESVTWTRAGADSRDFTISGGILSFTTPPDYENPADAGRNNDYQVIVQAKAGRHTIQQAVTVTVTPVDEPPALTGSPVPSEVSYAENDTAEVARYTATDPEGATVMWSVTGTDAEDFTIGKSDGVLRFTTPPNYEAATDANGDNIYAVIVQASDGDNATPQALTVTVNNLDEAGSLTLSSEQPQVETALTATLSDLDGDITDESWVWESGSSNSGPWTAIEGETSDRYTPVADDVDNYLRVRVSYTDGHTESGSKDLQHTFTNPVRAAPVHNESPAFTTASVTRTVGVNARAGSHVGASVRAEDPGDPLTYTLDETDPDAACFDIDWISGQLTVGSGGLSPCTNSQTTGYTLTVIATDPSGESDEIPVFITVTSSPPPPPPPPSGPSGPPRGGTQGDDSTPAEPTGYLENPGHNSFQSGIGVLSGWVCEAEKVEIEIETERGETERQVAGYGTERLDTETVCGDTDNGFGLLFNWNLLGAGEHTVVALVDEVELGRAMVTVTTVGTGEEEEFLRDVAGECVVADFPTEGETVTLAWQETQQNFVIAGERAPTGPNRAGVAGVGYLENPGPNSFQSGIGLISGWVCEAEAVEIEIETERGEVTRLEAAYGTERGDTAVQPDGTLLCGDTDNGFGLLFNWNRLGAGEHTVVAYVDDVELGRAVVRVTTVGEGAEEEFLRGAEGECVVADFPMDGQTATLEWQQNSQNFVITDAE